ncbi:MAG: thioredoxin domain-containing protein [Bilophila sp.]
MQRKILWAFLVLWLTLTAYLLFLSDKWASAAPAPATISAETFNNMLREALRKDPDLLLEILRSNSESVLDIAQEGSNQRRRKALLTQWKSELNQSKAVELKGRPLRGATDAAVTIVAFSDFTCPYCQQGAVTVQKLLSDYNGKIKYVFKHFPLEGEGVARLAAEYHAAAGLQGNDKSWQYYDMLFSRRAELLKDGESALIKAAKDIGLDTRRLATDVKSKAVREMVTADMAEAAKLGVQGTPYFLVNNLVVRGALSPELFSEAINMALQATGKK